MTRKDWRKRNSRLFKPLGVQKIKNSLFWALTHLTPNKKRLHQTKVNLRRFSATEKSIKTATSTTANLTKITKGMVTVVACTRTEHTTKESGSLIRGTVTEV